MTEHQSTDTYLSLLLDKHSLNGLEYLAREHDCSQEEVIKRALGNELFLHELIKKGGRVFTMTDEEGLIELTFSPVNNEANE